jgi:hypothetical protein
MILYRDLHVAQMFDPLPMLFVDQLYADRKAFVPYHFAHVLVLPTLSSVINGDMNFTLTMVSKYTKDLVHRQDHKAGNWNDTDRIKVRDDSEYSPKRERPVRIMCDEMPPSMVPGFPEICKHK